MSCPRGGLVEFDIRQISKVEEEVLDFPRSEYVSFGCDAQVVLNLLDEGCRGFRHEPSLLDKLVKEMYGYVTPHQRPF